MTDVSFAIPPSSLLPAKLEAAQLNRKIALHATEKSPLSAEGLSVIAMSASIESAHQSSVRAPASIKDMDEDGVLEVQLSSNPEPTIETFTVKKLKAFANNNGVSLHGLSTKKQMVEKIRSSGLF